MWWAAPGDAILLGCHVEVMLSRGCRHRNSLLIAPSCSQHLHHVCVTPVLCDSHVC